MKILATVCARGGSKGVKDKNIRLLAGKPLIYYSIDTIQKWNKANLLVCATDSTKIAQIAVENWVDMIVKLPERLTTDTSGKVGSLKYTLNHIEKKLGMKFDAVLDLDVSAPIRTVKNVAEAFNQYQKYLPDVLYSVVPARRNPYFNMVELQDKKGHVSLSKKLPKIVMSRQQAPVVYDMNASIYIYKRNFLHHANSVHEGKAMAYVMDELSMFDLDSEQDFHFVEFLFKNGYFKYE